MIDRELFDARYRKLCLELNRNPDLPLQQETADVWYAKVSQFTVETVVAAFELVSAARIKAARRPDAQQKGEWWPSVPYFMKHVYMARDKITEAEQKAMGVDVELTPCRMCSNKGVVEVARYWVPGDTEPRFTWAEEVQMVVSWMKCIGMAASSRIRVEATKVFACTCTFGRPHRRNMNVVPNIKTDSDITALLVDVDEWWASQNKYSYKKSVAEMVKAVKLQAVADKTNGAAPS